MIRRVYFIVAVLLLGLNASVWARVVGVSFRGTLLSPELIGACSALPADYDFYCPSGNCVCDTYVGTLSGGLVGTDKNAHLSLTVDNGASTTSLATGCVPFFGVMNFSTIRETETDNVAGVVCSGLGNPVQNTVTGGLGIESSTQGVAGGWGTLSGSLDKRKAPAKLTVSARVRINL